MHVFVIPEGINRGPFKCPDKSVAAFKRCDDETMNIVLTNEEYASLPKGTAEEIVEFIFRSRIGRIRCDKHVPQGAIRHKTLA